MTVAFFDWCVQAVTFEIVRYSHYPPFNQFILCSLSPSAISDCLWPDHRPVPERGWTAVLAVTVISSSTIAISISCFLLTKLSIILRDKWTLGARLIGCWVTFRQCMKIIGYLLFSSSFLKSREQLDFCCFMFAINILSWDIRWRVLQFSSRESVQRKY